MNKKQELIKLITNIQNSKSVKTKQNILPFTSTGLN